MSSYGNSVVATNVSIQRPIKMNWNTGLSTINSSTPTVDIRETGVEINGLGEILGTGLQNHAAYEISFQQPTTAATCTLVLTIPGTTASSAYKPDIYVVRTLSSQWSATGEDHYVVRTSTNSFDIARVGRSGNDLVGAVRVFVQFSVNTDSLLS